MKRKILTKKFQKYLFLLKNVEFWSRCKKNEIQKEADQIIQTSKQAFSSLIFICSHTSQTAVFDNVKLNVFTKEKTSLPYFRVKLSCVSLMFAYRKKRNDL